MSQDRTIQRLGITFRLVVHLLALWAVLRIWRAAPDPYNDLVLVVPGLLFLVDGDLRGCLGASGLATRSRAASTGLVAISSVASGLGVVAITQVDLAHLLFRPAAVLAALCVAGMLARLVRAVPETGAH